MGMVNEKNWKASDTSQQVDVWTYWFNFKLCWRGFTSHDTKTIADIQQTSALKHRRLRFAGMPATTSLCDIIGRGSAVIKLEAIMISAL
jgi:hypothetical protein